MNATVMETQIKTYGEPVWELAWLFPAQGHWTEEEYLSLETNRLTEYSHGHIEVLPMPTPKHQRIIAHLFLILHTLNQRLGGTVLFASVPMRLWPGKFREPDLLFLLPEHRDREHEKYCDTADLVVEVVSEGNRTHDLETKYVEYALAGIPEYWIVDPLTETITVLTLAGERYVEHGVFGRGETATSVLLPELKAAVDSVFDAD